MEQWRKDAIDRLKQVGYLDVVSKMVEGMCAPFSWSEQSGDSPAEVLGNGTICYVDTGTRRIGVSASHVYETYVEHLKTHDNVECQFGENTIRPETRLIEYDSALDLATFDIPEVFVATGACHYHHAPKWPPDALRQRDVVLCGGWPQVLRDPSINNVDFGFQYFITPIDSPSAERISIDPAISTLHWPGHEGEDFNADFRGLSGGPVYRVIDGPPVDRLELVGFIYNRIMELILARPASMIAPDGTILAISEFPKGRKYLISLSFRGKASVRPAQVGGFDVNIVIHGSTAVRGRGDLVAYRWALWKLTAPWTHRTRPPHLGKRCAFSTSSTGPFPSNHSRKTPKGPKIALGNPDRPTILKTGRGEERW